MSEEPTIIDMFHASGKAYAAMADDQVEAGHLLLLKDKAVVSIELFMDACARVQQGLQVIEETGKKGPKLYTDFLHFETFHSAEDEAFIATEKGHPGMSTIGETRREALLRMFDLVSELDD